MMDTKENDYEITLDNAIYLLGSANNLISVSQWARHRDDNGVMSRGNFSYFI